MKNFNELEKLITILKKKKLKVCIAESLTGGKVAYSFVKKKGASEIFLLHSKKLMDKNGYKINNLDITLICEKPKISKYKTEFKKNLSTLLNINAQDINVKATTTEKLGFLGREEGIACHAVITVSKNEC